MIFWIVLALGLAGLIGYLYGNATTATRCFMVLAHINRHYEEEHGEALWRLVARHDGHDVAFHLAAHIDQAPDMVCPE